MGDRGETVETVETVSDFIFWGAPKSLQMVTAAMKLSLTVSPSISHEVMGPDAMIFVF